jgi:predicted KAP-like P-loop ATPase
VFIDDLDRTDPTVVPKLLLALRELLDVPKFVFVLAFDRGTVSRALAEYNTAWGPSGEAFLEKIIDFPFELPTPTPGQVKALAVRQFGELCPFVPLDRLNEVAALLPDNPRRLKLFAL